MDICKYCKDKGMNVNEYRNFKSNIVATAKAIRSQLKYNGGMYYPVSELFNSNDLMCDMSYSDDMKEFVIYELKQLDIEFFDNCTLYRVCS